MGEILTRIPVGRTRASEGIPGLTLQVRGTVLTFRLASYSEQYLIKDGPAYVDGKPTSAETELPE